jgi:hypothetical protein
MANFTDEIAAEMDKNLNVVEADEQKKCALIALANLELAAELLEKSNMVEAADLVTNVMEKVAGVEDTAQEAELPAEAIEIKEPESYEFFRKLFNAKDCYSTRKMFRYFVDTLEQETGKHTGKIG